jgi:hypothetical protein
MIARDAATLMHSIITGALRSRASQMDAKISTAGSFRAIYRQYRRAHTLPFFALAASRPPADQDQLRAENARLRTSLTTWLTSWKIRSRRKSMRPDRGARIALWKISKSRRRPCVSPEWVPKGYSRGTRVPLWGVLEYSATGATHPDASKKRSLFCIYILLHFSTGFVVLIWNGRTLGV